MILIIYSCCSWNIHPLISPSFYISWIIVAIWTILSSSTSHSTISSRRCLSALRSLTECHFTSICIYMKNWSSSFCRSFSICFKNYNRSITTNFLNDTNMSFRSSCIKSKYSSNDWYRRFSKLLYCSNFPFVSIDGRIMRNCRSRHLLPIIVCKFATLKICTTSFLLTISCN